jgi:hypothetical protein
MLAGPYAAATGTTGRAGVPVQHSISRTRQRRRAVLASAALALVLAACGGTSDAPVTPAPSDGASTPGGTTDGDAAVTVDDRPRSPFTGLPVDPEVLTRPLLAVKVENSENARPQSGLEAADIVFEELVEGGITRFMALYHSALPAEVGPVRSARPVDADLLSGFGPSGFAYSGARAEVQELLAATPAVRVVEGVDGFFRDDVRRAPHNLYVDAGEVLDVVTARGARPLVDIGWTFSDDVPDGALSCPASATSCADPGASVVVEMSAAFRSGWTYDASAGVYRRDQNGRAFATAGPGEIGAANVVVLATRHYVGASGYDETDATTTGAPALVLRDGRRYEARWEKPTASDLLRVLTPDGEPFPLAPGPTWVHLPASDRMPEIG